MTIKFTPILFKAIMITSILLNVCSNCYAQNRFKEGINSALYTNFEVTALNDNDYISIKEQGSYTPTKPKELRGFNKLSVCRYKDEDAVYHAFAYVLGINKLLSIQRERTVVLNFYVDRTGRIINILYIAKKNTQITPNELERINTLLKQNVSIIIPPSEDTSDKISPLIQHAGIQQILEYTDRLAAGVKN
jgi:hypothetical protein